MLRVPDDVARAAPQPAWMRAAIRARTGGLMPGESSGARSARRNTRPCFRGQYIRRSVGRARSAPGSHAAPSPSPGGAISTQGVSLSQRAKPDNSQVNRGAPHRDASREISSISAWHAKCNETSAWGAWGHRQRCLAITRYQTAGSGAENACFLHHYLRSAWGLRKSQSSGPRRQPPATTAATVSPPRGPARGFVPPAPPASPP